MAITTNSVNQLIAYGGEHYEDKHKRYVEEELKRLYATQVGMEQQAEKPKHLNPKLLILKGIK